MKRSAPKQLNGAQAEEVALKAFLFLANDTERLSRFAGISGFDMGNAREAATAPGFLAGVLSYYLNDEGAILAFCESEAFHPLSIALAYRVIPGGDPFLEINSGI